MKVSPRVRSLRLYRSVGIVLAFLLFPYVLGVVVLVSLLAERYHEIVLAAATALWVFLVSLVRLPEDSDDDVVALLDWLRRGWRWKAMLASLLAVAIFFVFEEIRQWVPGNNWAGLAVQLSFLLFPFAVVLYQTRRFLTRAWALASWGLGIVAALTVIAWPIVALKVVDGPLAWWEALLYTAPPAVAFLVAMLLLRADRVEGKLPLGGLEKMRTSRAEEADERARRRPRSGLALTSIAIAVLSSFLLLASALRVPVERRLIETSQIAERGAFLRQVELGNPGSLSDAEERMLLARYSPVLRLHEREEWIAYNASTVADTVNMPVDEACDSRGEGPCGALMLERPVLEALPDRKPPENTRVFVKGAVYPKLVDVEAEITKLGDTVPAFARKTRWLAQYWLFYPFNDWKGTSAIGTLTQEHDGDWEWVGVGLDEVAAPAFVAYSAHCTGSWRPWGATASVAADGTRVLVGGSDAFPASHPLVIVARGSHANYPTPGTREPDWGSCKLKRAGKAFRWLTFITAAREETPDLGPYQVPEVLAESETLRQAQRPLWWGEDGETRFGPIRIAVDLHGPSSPVYKEAWERPMETIFDGNWECDAGKPACP